VTINHVFHSGEINMMKQLLATSAALAMLAAAGTASAQTAQPNDGVVGAVVMNLSADVSSICGAVDFINPVGLNFNDLAAVDTATPVTRSNNVTIICNSANGGTVTLSSANSGELRRGGTETGAGRTIPYTVGTNTVGNGFMIAAGSSLASPIARTFSGSTAIMAGQGVTYNFTTNGVLQSNVSGVNNGERTTVFAGNYTDTVTVSVTAN
jgi:spore coat protein U-like protein